MDTNQGRAPLHGGNHRNPSPHNITPRWGPLAIFFQVRGTNTTIGGNLCQNFGRRGRENVVQTTVETMADVMGGMKFLHTNLYDKAVGFPIPRSARMVCNTWIILREETRMTEVADPWGGVIHDGDLDVQYIG